MLPLGAAAVHLGILDEFVGSVPPDLFGPDKKFRAKVTAKNSANLTPFKKGEYAACISKIAPGGGLQLDAGSTPGITGKGMIFLMAFFVCLRAQVRSEIPRAWTPDLFLSGIWQFHLFC